MKEVVTHINTPLGEAERAVLERIARIEGRSLGRQIRQLAISQLIEMGLLARDPSTGTVMEGGES